MIVEQTLRRTGRRPGWWRRVSLDLAAASQRGRIRPLYAWLILLGGIAVLLLLGALRVVAPVQVATSQGSVAQQLRADVEALCTEECAGRRVGEPGSEVALEYLEARLSEIGVEPAPGSRGYRQGFAVTRGIRVSGTPTVQLDGEQLAAGEDYAVAAFSGSGIATQVPLVFAGYGIVAPGLNWNSYAGIDPQGAAVVLVRGEPQLGDSGALFGGDKPTQHSDLRRKAAVARDLGAVAVIVLENPLQGGTDELPEIRPTYSAASFDLPVLHLRWLLLQNGLIGATGLSLHELIETIDLEGRPLSALLPELELTIDLAVEKDMATGFNLIGVVPGSEPELGEQYVVIGAHYDHIGIGGPESMAPEEYGTVHPGANDNASGVAGALQLAGWAAENRDQLERSLLVCLFSGEEVGLLGSTAFVRKPPVPAEQIYCMVNMDMIGEPEGGKLLLGGLDTAAELPEITQRLAGRHALQLSAGGGASTYGGDHLAFVRQGYPALFVFAGLGQGYHTPRDTPDQLDYAGMERILGFVTDLLAELATRPEPLVFTPPQDWEATPRAQTEPLPVSMGTVPSFEEHAEPGYFIGDVVPGGPAAEAGLQPGDRIVKILDRRVANVYDFMFALEDLQPGQTVSVRIIRDGEELEFAVTLAAKGVAQ